LFVYLGSTNGAMGVLRDSFLSSDGMGQGIVILLLMLSAFTWSFMILKGWMMGSIRRGCTRFMKRFDKTSRAPLTLAQYLSDDDDQVMDSICQAGMNALKTIFEREDAGAVNRILRTNELPRPLTEAEKDKIRSSMVRVLNERTSGMEWGMTLLSCIVTVAPFCGLFGTVWGVMLVFFQMAAQGGHPQISDMASGVSSALLTTVAGLIVAIPAVFGSNLITANIDKTNAEMQVVIEEFISSLSLEEGEATVSSSPRTASAAPARVAEEPPAANPFGRPRDRMMR